MTRAIIAAEAHIKTGDWEALARRAHQLAGSSGVLGILMLHSAFRRLEMAARSCDRDTAINIAGECQRSSSMPKL